MHEIREKPPVLSGLKEKAKSAPKELVRRGLDDGTERLRGQFRDAAQRGREEDYDGGRIEDAAADGMRRMARGTGRLPKGRKKQPGRSQESGRGQRDDQPIRPEVPASKRDSSIQESPTRDISSQPPSARDSPAQRSSAKGMRENSSIRSNQSPSPKGTPPAMPEAAQDAGRQAFAQEQGRALAIRRAEQRLARRDSIRPHTTGGTGQLVPTRTANLAPETGRTSDRAVSRPARIHQKAAGRAARNSIKTAERTAKQTVKTADRTARTAQKTARTAAQAAHRSAQTARATAKAAATTVREAIRVTAAAIKASIAATKALVAALSAGGAAAIVVVVVICLIGLIVASPFGIFFAGDDPATGAVSPAAAASQINAELADLLEGLQTNGSYDSVAVSGQPPPWAHVFAVFATKTASGDDGMDVAVLDADRVERLRTVFWDMCVVTTEVDEIEHGDSDPNDDVDDGWMERNLYITITAKTPDEMRTAYAFTDQQNELLDELLSNETLLAGLAGDLSISDPDARTLLAALPDDLSPERKAVMETACRLAGKVNYFWGGKSLILGWDSRWGQLQKVWAEGSSTTGTWRPYGLDCSGYVDWVFYNASSGDYYPGQGGGAASQRANCTPVSWDAVKPGDLVFYADDSHVGIAGGWDDAGNLLVIHCSAGANNVVVTDSDGFAVAARPPFFGE